MKRISSRESGESRGVKDVRGSKPWVAGREGKVVVLMEFINSAIAAWYLVRCRWQIWSPFRSSNVLSCYLGSLLFAPAANSGNQLKRQDLAVPQLDFAAAVAKVFTKPQASHARFNLHMAWCATTARHEDLTNGLSLRRSHYRFSRPESWNRELYLNEWWLAGVKEIGAWALLISARKWSML